MKIFGRERTKNQQIYHQQKKVGMERLHPAKGKRKLHQTGSGVEPIGKTKLWKAKANMEKRDGRSDGDRGLQLETKIGEDGPKSY